MTNNTNDGVTLSKHELSNMLVCAFRYSLGRMTYVTSECAGWISQYWGLLHPLMQKQIQDEIRRAIDMDLCGDACDIAEWKTLLDLPVKGKV